MVGHSPLLLFRNVHHKTHKGHNGNVVLDSGPDRLQGEHLELNLNTRVGFMEHAQGFLQTYYITGERLDKRGPDHYYIRGGSFTTCEGVLPDWSIHASSTELTIDEYLHAWNPTLRLKKLPLLYLPYAIFPIKRDRSTGLLIPVVSLGGADGITVRNAFYWAPRDNFDATIGIDYLQKTGWGVSAEMRYLLSPHAQGPVPYRGEFCGNGSGRQGKKALLRDKLLRLPPGRRPLRGDAGPGPHGGWEAGQVGLHRESVVEPRANLPTSLMPRFKLGDDDVKALVIFLKSRRGMNFAETSMEVYRSRLNQRAPSRQEEPANIDRAALVPAGEKVFRDRACAACHRLGSVDGGIAPDLSFEGLLKTEEWLYEHFRDPRSRVADSIMPAFRFSPADSFSPRLAFSLHSCNLRA